MEAIQNKRWFVILFFLVLGMLLVAFIYAAVVGPQGYQQRIQDRYTRYSPIKVTQPDKATLTDPKSFTLFLNRAESVGKIRLTYRGLDQERVKIDVIIPELDPKMAYAHAIPIRKAKQEMRLGHQRFKLTDIGRSKIKLERIK